MSRRSCARRSSRSRTSRFYEHNGVDTRGIARALWEDVRSQGVVEGGSTITQQFVKNAYVRNERTIARKVREAALAWQLEQRWSKDRILLAYLNTIYFGNGAYGIQQAARTYFGKGARRLTLAESALLAGLPADPSLYDPTQHPRAAKQRRRYVLQTMFDQGKITAAPAAQRIAGAPAEGRRTSACRARRGPGQYFVNYVKDQLIATYGAGRVFGGGLKVTSTIDLELQETAHRAIESVLKTPGGPAAALVAIDPRTGAVRAMVGGSNFRESQFNLATQAERQPGSSFKPIVLATALRQGISPVDDVRLEARRHRRRRPDLARHELRGRLPRPRRPRPGDGLLRQLGLRPADEARRPEGDRQDRARARDPQRARPVLLDRARRRRRQPARHDARLRDVREPRRPRRRLADGGSTAGSSSGSSSPAPAASRRTGPSARATMTTGEADLLTSILQRVVTQGTGKRAALRRPARRRQDGHDRQLRRRVVRRLHPAARRRGLGRLPRQAEADADRVRRQAGRRRHAAGADLEGVHDGRRQAARSPSPSSSRRRRTSRRRRSGSSGAAARTSSTTATARAPGSSPTSPAAGPATQAECYANEVTVPLVIGKTVDAANETLAQQPLGSELIGVPAKPGKRPGYVVKQEPRNGFLSANGDGAALRHAARPALRAAAEPRRLERHGRPVAPADAQGTDDDHVRQGTGRLGARADAGAGRRGRARAQGHAGRGPRPTPTASP